MTIEVPQSEEKPEMRQCPTCNKESLYWDKNAQIYECLNNACKRRFTEEQLSLSRQKKPKRATGSDKSINYKIIEHIDIICAKCGTHFYSVETARAHRGHCWKTPNDQYGVTARLSRKLIVPKFLSLQRYGKNIQEILFG
jgi:hypothetical protein